MRRWLHRQVLCRRWLTFLVMVLAFLGFGAGSVNLFFVLKANLAFLAEHGWDAVMEGGLGQLVGLLAGAIATMAAYVLFKTCEHRLVNWLDSPPDESTRE